MSENKLSKLYTDKEPEQECFGENRDNLVRNLEEIIDKMGVDHFDEELVKNYLDLLEKIDPVPMDFSMEEAYADFRQSNFPDSTLEESQKIKPLKKKAPSWRGFRAVAAVLVIAFGLTAVAGKVTGTKPFQQFIYWKDDILQIFTEEPSGEMIFPQRTADQPYESLEAALESNGISSKHCPTWIPEDLSISTIEVTQLSQIATYTAVYEGKTRGLLIHIIHQLGGAGAVTIEKNPGPVKAYEHKGREYYITFNLDICNVVWAIDEVTFNFAGQLTEKEAKKIIDSIPE